MTIIAELKAGKCLCLVCKKVTEPNCTKVTRGFDKFTVTSCGNRCTYEDGQTVAAITWSDILTGDVTPDGLSVTDEAWLQANYPEILAERDRAEFGDTLGASVTELHTVAHLLNTTGEALKANVESFASRMAELAAAE